MFLLLGQTGTIISKFDRASTQSDNKLYMYKAGQRVHNVIRKVTRLITNGKDKMFNHDIAYRQGKGFMFQYFTNLFVIKYNY